MDFLDYRGYPRRSVWSVLYAAAFVMGILYLTDIAEARSLAGATDSTAALSWQWTLFFGGIVGLAGNLAPRHRYRTALTIEAAGALSTAVMVSIFVGVIWIAPSIGTTPYATIVWMSAVAAALLGRFLETFWQRSRALDFAAAVKALDTHNQED